MIKRINIIQYYRAWSRLMNVISLSFLTNWKNEKIKDTSLKINPLHVYATLWNYAVPRISYYCKSIASVARHLSFIDLRTFTQIGRDQVILLLDLRFLIVSELLKNLVQLFTTRYVISTGIIISRYRYISSHAHV